MVADNDVVVALLNLVQCVHARVGDIDGRALAHQDIKYQFRNVDLIIDDENLLALERPYL